MTGVDLSVKMINKAGKGLYDKLIVDDAAHFMQREEQSNEQRYDLITAADLFTYLADLEPMFLAARTTILLNAMDGMLSVLNRRNYAGRRVSRCGGIFLC